MPHTATSAQRQVSVSVSEFVAVSVTESIFVARIVTVIVWNEAASKILKGNSKQFGSALQFRIRRVKERERVREKQKINLSKRVLKLISN